MTTVSYFAYGSNMLRERLLARCPGSVLRGRATLPDSRLTFDKVSKDGSGKCAFEPSRGDAMAGVLWQVPEAELGKLDQLEGVGSGYERCEIAVQEVGGTCDALTYRATKTKYGLLPYDWYLALVVAGAQQQGLPSAVVERLQQVRSRRDPKLQRRQRLEALDVLRSAGFGEVADGLQ